MSSICANMAKSSDYPQTTRAYVLSSASAICTIALLVILGMGAAGGSLSMSAMGYSAIGLAAGGVLCNSLIDNDIKKHKWTIMTNVVSAAAVITLAALGITGILSAKIVGVAAICSMLAVEYLGSKIRRCDPKERERLDKLREESKHRTLTEDLKTVLKADQKFVDQLPDAAKKPFMDLQAALLPPTKV